MDIGNRVFKVVSYIFFIFIIMIIVIQFGMPNFIGGAADSNRFKAAQLGKEIISRRDVARARDNIVYQQFQGQQIPATMEEQIKSYALEQLIEQKRLLILSQKIGVYPGSQISPKLVKNYLNENFSSYKTLTGFDFERFEKEILVPNKISLNQLTKEAENAYALTTTMEMFRDLSIVPVDRIEDWAMLKQISYSLTVAYFDYLSLRKLLTKQITPKEIQEQFVAKYLKDNPKEKLTGVIREAIVKGIVDKRLPEFEKTWKQQLQKDSATLSLSALAKKNSGNLVQLHNISAEKGMQASSDKELPANVLLLEKNPDFLAEIFQAEKGKVLGPWESEGNTFLVVVNNRSLPNFSQESIANVAEENTEEIKQSIQEKDFTVTQMALQKKLHEKIPVKRFSMPQ